MSFDLIARMRMVDQMSRPLRSLGSNLLSTTGRLTGLTAGVGALVGATTGAAGAIKLFNSTIGAAAKSEMATMSMTALFKGNEKAAKEYYDYIQMKGAESVLSDDDFMEASKTFVIMTKNMGELKELTNIAERLAVLDPAQGISGAAIALRELQSGDIVSLSERFEMPKKTLNAIKNLPLKKQLAALDKELSSYGVTQEMIFAQGQTSLGMYNKTVDKTRVAFRNMGFSALEELKPLLRDINVWLDKNSAAVTKFGSGILTDLAVKFRSAFDYIRTNFIDNPEFMRMNLSDKVSFVLNSDATTKVIDFAKNIGTQFMTSFGASMLTAVKENPMLALVLGGVVGLRTGGYVGLVVGLSIAASPAVMEMLDFIRRNSTAGKAEAKLEGVTSLASKLSTQAAGVPLLGPTALTDTKPKELSPLAKIGKAGSDFAKNPFWLNDLGNLINGSHRTGLDKVPFDGYVAQLHKGEKILPRREAQAYREGTSMPDRQRIVPRVVRIPGGKSRDEAVLPRAAARDYRNNEGSGGGVTVTGNTFNVRQDSDINAIATQLYRLINGADNAMGGAY